LIKARIHLLLHLELVVAVVLQTMMNFLKMRSMRKLMFLTVKQREIWKMQMMKRS